MPIVRPGRIDRRRDMAVPIDGHEFAAMLPVDRWRRPVAMGLADGDRETLGLGRSH